MRIWDINPKYLCRQHLLAEHRELHAIWNVITKKKKGYSRHPETLRWIGKLNALYKRHEILVKEFARRGYKHHSPLKKVKNMGSGKQTKFINTIKEQKKILTNKPCACLLK